jgi:hypothetical protein
VQFCSTKTASGFRRELGSVCASSKLPTPAWSPRSLIFSQHSPRFQVPVRTTGRCRQVLSCWPPFGTCEVCFLFSLFHSSGAHRYREQSETQNKDETPEDHEAGFPETTLNHLGDLSKAQEPELHRRRETSGEPFMEALTDRTRGGRTHVLQSWLGGT